MLFKELITLLKKVKNPDDINEEVSDHLINAAIASVLALVVQDLPEDEELDPTIDIKMARSIILEHIDNIILQSIIDHNELN